jgi:hypothetical protein
VNKTKNKRRGLISNVRCLRSKNLVRLAAFGTVGLGLTHQIRAATLVTFEGFTAKNISIASLPDYGDNVSANSADYTVSPGLTGVIGTPNTTLDWLGQWDTYPLWDGRGTVAQSDFNGGSVVSIVFTPSELSAVRLGSFELDEYAAGGEGAINWDVSRPTGDSLGSGTWTMTNAGGRSLISPNVTGLLGESVTLSLTLVSGAPSYFALDNLAFDQVPEPSPLALGALSAGALGAAAMRRRRRA